ncbi:MAG TPA: chromate efflux transporter [Ignavibacteria bacterium]
MSEITNFGLFRYFFYLGSTVFGGPLAVIDMMRYDLVMNKKWLTFSEFEDIFGYAQIAPGPLAFQVAVYFSYFKKGFWGAVAGGIGFVLPSFFLVLAFSFFYLAYKDISYIENCLYGLSPVIIAIIFYSGYKLSTSILKKEIILYLLFAASIILTVFFKVYIIFLIIGAAIISVVYYSISEKKINKNKLSIFSLYIIPIAVLGFSKVILFIKEISVSKMLEMALLFLKVGSLTYGSGFVIVGVLKQEVVDARHWLTAKEFIDGIAFGQITPGPVVITSTFIGYIMQGIPGAIISTICIFLPTFIFVLILARQIGKYKYNFYLKSLIKGANAAAIGAILSTAYLLSKDAIIDIPTFILFVAALPVLFFTKIKSIYIIIAAALAGILIKTFIFP